MSVAFSGTAAAVSGLFAVLVLRKYLAKGGMHNLCWTVGLALWCVVSTLEAASDVSWSDPAYRAYYVLSAALVAFLGAGTLFLLRDARLARIYLVYAVLVTAVFAVVAGVAATDPAGLAHGGSIGGTGWSTTGGYPAPRLATFLLTIPGSLILIGGALLSAWRTKTSYNLFIAAGATAIALAGSIAKVASADYIPLGNIIAISLMFIGFQFAAFEARLPSPGPDPTKHAPV